MKNLNEIKEFILNAPLPELRHGIAQLIDYLNNNINQQTEVTPKQGKSQGEKRGKRPSASTG